MYIIIIYVIYKYNRSYANRSYIRNIGPEFVSKDVIYIAQACILYRIYCMMVTSPAQCAHGRSIYIIRTHQIKGMMSTSYII